MMRKSILIWLLVVCAGVSARAGFSEVFVDKPLFHSTDALAPRDEWGMLHQAPFVTDVDFAARYPWRPLYWLESGRQLSMQPAYVGALQRDLARLGYYCGPIDGVFSPEVSEALAKLQKNYSQRVNGRLTVPVRRALHLP